jgi:hypothetical protein
VYIYIEGEPKAHMATKKDLIGQRFGRLTVLEDVGRKYGEVLWKCQCDCGNIVNVVAGGLRSGHTQSCGCYQRERVAETQKKDLTEKKFGRLLVLEDVGRKNGSILWKCQCECGNIVNVVSDYLQNDHTRSCGCYKRARASETQKKDLIGQKFGRLTVLEDVGRSHRCVIWKCLCECGNIVNVTSSHLQDGTTQSCGCYNRERVAEATSGKLHPNWKGGITPLYVAIRNCTHYRSWRTTVFQRDSFTCQHCNKVGGKLHAHHIIFFSTIVEEHNITTLEKAKVCESLWDAANGITLCKKCHKTKHKKKA